MRATVAEIREPRKLWLIPLIIFILSICIETFFGNFLFYHSHNTIISVQNFLNNTLKITLFDNQVEEIKNTTIYNNNTNDTDDNPIRNFISQVNFEIIFSETFHFFNTNFCYLIFCAVLYNFINVYKIFVLANSIFLGNFISSTLCFIFHSPKPYMVYYSIKPIIMFTDWGSPNSQVVVLVAFFLTLYKILLNNKKMKEKIVAKIILLCLILGVIILDIFLLFASGNIAYNQIIFSILIGIVTYQILFFIFKVEVNNSKQLFNFLKFKLSYYLAINISLMLFQSILYIFVIDKSDEDYFYKNIDIQQTRLLYSEFLSNYFNYRLYFYLDKGNLCDVICFLMNIVSFIALKIELKLTFKEDYENWSENNFEKKGGLIENNSNVNDSDEFFVINGTQWNHNGWCKGFIRLIFIIGFCLACLVPTVFIYFVIDFNQINGFIFLMTLPLILLTFGTFYFFKAILRFFKLTKKNY